MTAMIRISALAAALLAATPAFAQTPPAKQGAPVPVTPTLAPDRIALGLELAQVLSNEAAIRTQLEKMLQVTMPAVLAADPAVAAMEAQYPGMVQAMIDAMAPIMERYIIAEMPVLWDQMGGLFARELTADELRAVIGFYRSPAGVSIIAVMSEEADFTTALRGAMNGGDRLTGRDLNAGILPGVMAMADRVSPEQLAEAEAFAATPAGRKFLTLLPRMQAISLSLANQPDPAMEAELESAVMGVVERFTGGTPVTAIEREDAAHG